MVALSAAATLVTAGCSLGSGSSAVSSESPAAQESTEPLPAFTPPPPPSFTPTANPELPAPESEEPADETADETVALPNSYKNLSDREWKKVVRSPDRYIGQGFILYANVVQFDAATGPTAFRAFASGKDERSYGIWTGYDNTIFVADSEFILANVVQGDVVRSKAVGEGSYSYDTQAGGNTTVPKFYVHKIKVIGSTDD